MSSNIIIFISIILLFIFITHEYILKDKYVLKDECSTKDKQIDYPILSSNMIEKHFSNTLLFNEHLFKKDRIFVSIASYRDPQCYKTLLNIIETCSDVSKLTICICQQNDPNDDFTIEYSNPLNVSIIYINMDSKLAKGPCWARFLIQQKFSNEEYYLQIDSHTRFVQNWDSILKSELSLLPEKSCLTNYVSTYNINTELIEKSPLRGPMYITELDKKDKFIRFNSNYIGLDDFNKPQLSKGWSGCFSFSKGAIVYDAPYDPNVPFLFFGEEMDIFARLYTHGWQMYIPSKPICFTIFDRSYRKTFWEHPEYKNVVNFSKMRVYDRLGYMNVQKELKTTDPRLKMGITKSLDDFYKYIGINKVNI